MNQLFEIVEYDEADNVIGTYVESGNSDSKPSSSRIDFIPPQSVKPSWQRLLDVFLPAGYPYSVTEDYLEYQIYDSLQAFSSSIAGLLSSRAVLSSVGVGDASASATAALLLSILQESAGRIATILFAHRLGTCLEPECKMYRLLADVLNDIAFVLDCLSPAFPRPVRVIVLSSSSVLRALCGVAAGSAKASLSAHFARWGNLGELNAKDSSQETVISLIGMLAGSLVVSWVTTPFATWTVLITLLAIHLETNRRAVRAVAMRSLNRQRATLVYHWLRAGKVPSPMQISTEERIFEREGVQRDNRGKVLGYCSMGCRLSTLLSGIGRPQKSTGSLTLAESTLPIIAALYKGQGYLLWIDNRHQGMTSQFHIALKQNATARDQITAWWQALMLAEKEQDLGRDLAHKPPGDRDVLEAIQNSIRESNEMLRRFEKRLIELGWNLNVGALETLGGTRISVKDNE